MKTGPFYLLIDPQTDKPVFNAFFTTPKKARSAAKKLRSYLVEKRTVVLEIKIIDKGVVKENES